MENKQNFYPKERPMAREHEKIERDLNVHDKRKFGGMYYTDILRWEPEIHGSRQSFGIAWEKAAFLPVKVFCLCEEGRNK